MNPNTNRIYVTSLSPSNILEIDGSTNTLINSIPQEGRIFGIDVNPTTNLIYAANRDANFVTVIDGSTNSILSTIETGSGPDYVGMNSNTNTIYVANRNSNNVTVIDGSTNNVVANVNVGIAPDYLGVNASTNHIYVSNENSNDITVINGLTNTVIGTANAGTAPLGVGVNPNSNCIYISNAGDNTVSVFADQTNNTPDFTLSIAPSSQTVQPGGTANYTLSRTDIGGFTGTVDVSVSGLPAGARDGLPSSFTFPVTLPIITSSSTPPGSYTFTVTGNANGITHTAQAQLIVQNQSSDFSISVTPSSQTVSPGGTANASITSFLGL